MTEKFIEELKPGQEVQGTFALRVKKLLPFRNGAGHYLAVALGDRTGQIEGRVWEAVEEINSGCRIGDIVEVAGQVTEYNGKPQIVISAMSCVAGDFNPERFIPASTLDLEAAQQRLFAVRESLQDTHLKSLLSVILADETFFKAFVTAPAAKRNHHATLGGLLEHSLGVAGAAARLAPFYPAVDRDLLVTGALLHDMGKVEEYNVATDIDFTDEGRLLGHIVLGAQMLDKYINQLPDFPRDLRLKLKHMLISHHGQYEWQSPKRPKFLEAALLHHLDMIDAEVNIFNSAVASREDPEERWTGYVKGLERYVFCK